MLRRLGRRRRRRGWEGRSAARGGRGGHRSADTGAAHNTTRRKSLFRVPARPQRNGIVILVMGLISFLPLRLFLFLRPIEAATPTMQEGRHQSDPAQTQPHLFSAVSKLPTIPLLPTVTFFFLVFPSTRVMTLRQAVCRRHWETQALASNVCTRRWGNKGVISYRGKSGGDVSSVSPVVVGRLRQLVVVVVVVVVGPPLKKSLFPVQRVAEIVASRAAAKSFPSPPLFFLVRK